MNPTQRLEEFLYGHKARCCEITRGNGYGATCWEIELVTEKGTITVVEVLFMEGELLPDCYEVGMKDGDWPGLEAVISLAVDKAEEKVRE